MDPRRLADRLEIYGKNEMQTVNPRPEREALRKEEQ